MSFPILSQEFSNELIIINTKIELKTPIKEIGGDKESKEYKDKMKELYIFANSHIKVFNTLLSSIRLGVSHIGISGNQCNCSIRCKGDGTIWHFTIYYNLKSLITGKEIKETLKEAYQ